MPSGCSNKRRTPRRVCIITGTRADWGLLTPVAKALHADADRFSLQIAATNMHLDPRFGATVNEIVDAGFSVDARVPMPAVDDTPLGRTRAMAQCLDGMATALAQLAPDVVVILGDRYEMLAAASAAAMLRIPVAHIAGGNISEGAIDDCLRHAITKLSSLHLTETEKARRRVIQLGEDPATVINAGALGVHNITHQRLLDAETLARTLDGFALDRGSSLLVTYHPATMDDADPAARFDELLAALDEFPGSRVLITYPNNDAGGAAIIERIRRYADANPGRVKAVPSLGMLRYLSALRCVAAVVGNSSSGIVEVPSMGRPTVDVGTRQAGRLCANSVFHCADDASSIAQTIAFALSAEGQQIAAQAVNPYQQPDTVHKIVEAIASMPPAPTRAKHFYDIPSNAN